MEDVIELTMITIKSEADKTIADKDKQIAELKKERDWLAKDRKQAYDDLEKRAQLNIKQEESIRHHKFKRCMAMARWCNERHTFNETNEKRTWLHKWHKRWLAIADKFKLTAQYGKENKMSENVINILKHEDGIETVIVEFGLGKVGIGLLSESESQRNMVVRLNELNEAKDVGAFLTAEEREENFKNTANPLEVALAFPDVKAIDNFIETLKIYRQKVFSPNARTRHG